jgi:hypothetical protein
MLNERWQVLSVSADRWFRRTSLVNRVDLSIMAQEI